MGNWIAFAIGIASALPSLITGIEAAFGKKSGQGAQKWIAVETALSGPISTLANEVAASVPNADASKISGEVAVWVKAVNDATVSFYNSVGWPVTPPVTPAPVTPPPAA